MVLQAKRERIRSLRRLKMDWPLYAMMLFPVALVFVFNYIPLVGIVIAFENYMPAKGILGSQFTGFKNFETLFNMPGFYQAIRNTLTMSFWKIASLGANLVLVDMDEEGLATCKLECEAFGVNALTFAADVSDETRANEIIDEAAKRFDHIDILVNNAGVWRRSMPFIETTSDMWKKYIDVNLLGTMYFTHAALQYMIPAESGRIINVASVAGVYGNANMVDYSTTKAAVIGFTKALAKELAPKRILVNAVSPGSVSSHQDVEEPSELSFLGRTGTHTENANLICFLAGDESTYIAGQNIQIDGCRKKM